MIIFNVTSIVEDSVHQDFYNFMHDIYMPAVLASNKFADAKLFRLTEPVNEGVTYCAQYTAHSPADLEVYRNEYLPELHHRLMKQFPEKIVVFSSVLELTQP
ncbi:DUF4286 family protein [Pseudopedobacter beijingensis]|uniref:DUF4286 family protein n=1 Tax=Pseudopedobacter beijingensis TaxID=1207056 RepID=A0ABW4ID42_9SPHI